MEIEIEKNWRWNATRTSFKINRDRILNQLINKNMKKLLNRLIHKDRPAIVNCRVVCSNIRFIVFFYFVENF